MDYDLVFEGGGAKGMVFVGAMQEFEERGHKYGRLLGTSAGAITATLLAAGYTSDEMLAALNEKQPDGTSVFSSFMATPGPFNQFDINKSSIRAFLRAVNIPLVPDFLEDKLDDAITEGLAASTGFRNFFSLFERGGWFSADKFLIWLEGKLNSGTYAGKPRNFGSMNLKQFFEATGTDLSLVASDTSGRQMLVLNHNTAPGVPVKWGARMSMSIPLLWQEVIWQSEWGRYNGRDIQGNSIVDGGLLSNFPIELFLSNLKDVTQVMGAKVSKEVLGFLIDEDAPVPNAPVISSPTRGFDLGTLATVQRISRLVDTTLSARDKMVIDSYSDMVVRMPAKGYGTTEFNMSEDRRNSLVAAGRQAMKAHFYALEHPAPVDFGVEIGTEAAAEAVINRIATKILK
jgi:predicted acylesterase/phospholipase RssA